MFQQYTQHSDDLYTQNLRGNFNDKNQCYYDYHGELDRDEDSADCYKAIKGVLIA